MIHPRAEYLAPPLQGLALREGAYRPMPLVRLPNGQHGHASESLGVHLWLRGSELRLFDPAIGRDLQTHQEMRRALEEADARLGEQSSARTAAEVRAADLEERAAEFEARAAEAESENAELRAHIRRLTGK